MRRRGLSVSLARLSLMLAFAVLVGSAGGYLVARAWSGGSGVVVPASVPIFGRAMPAPAHDTTVAVTFAPAGTDPARAALLSASSSTAPFTECPAVGADSSCGELVRIVGAGPAAILRDLSQGPYDGTSATLIGVVNDSVRPVTGLEVSADSGVFALGDSGICAVGYRVASLRSDCRGGADAYAGPGVSLTSISDGGRRGSVHFAVPLAPGGTAYFALAQALAANAAPAEPSTAQVGGAPNPSVRQAVCTSADPVNCATGQLWEQYTDFSAPGRGPGLLLTRTYSSAVGLTAEDSPFGFGWSFDYGMSAHKDPTTGDITIRQENGSTVDFQPDASGSYTAAAWVAATLVSRPDGTVFFARSTDHLSFTFDPAGRLESIGDTTNAEQTRLSYDADGITVTDAAGRALRLDYVAGHVVKVTDPLGRSDRYRYDQATGDLTTVTDDLGDAWNYHYRDHLLMSITDALEHTTKFVYAADRVVQRIDPAGHTTAWSYAGNAAEAGGGTTIVTDPDAEVTTYDYADLQLTALTAGTGSGAQATTLYTHDATTQYSSVTDPNGHVTSYVHDPQGDLTRTTDPLGRTTTYAYDSLGDQTSVTTALNETTTSGYDTAGNTLWSSDPMQRLTQYMRSPVGTGHPADTTEVIDAGRIATHYTYDAYGDIASISTHPTPAETDTTQFVYNTDGQLLCQVAPDALASHVACPQSADAPHVKGTTSYTYDAIGRLTAVTDPAGDTSTTSYYGDGSVKLSTNLDGKSTHYQYDADARQTETITGYGSTSPLTTATRYTDGGRIKQQIDGNGRNIDYTYDAVGQPITVQDQLGRVTRRYYDRAGNLTRTDSPTGTSTLQTFDADNELLTETHPGGDAPAASFSYNADGQRQSMTDGTGTSEYLYNMDHELTNYVNGAGKTTAYEYDATGNLQTLTYPDGLTATYTYDDAGQMTSVADGLGNTVRVSHDASGVITKQDYPGGVRASFTTDSPNGPDGAPIATSTVTAQIGGATVASFADTLDKAGLVTKTVDTLPGVDATTTAYGYDPQGRVSSVNGASVEYDHAGGVTKLPSGAIQRFDAAGQLQTTAPGTGAPPHAAGGYNLHYSTAYTYNDQGDRTSESSPATTVNLSYNQADQLTGYQAAASTTTYTYDGSGLRASKTTKGKTSVFTWNPAAQVPTLLSDGTNDYLYGPDDQPIEQVTGAAASFLLGDQHGSTRLLTDAHGTVLAAYAYTATGTATKTTGEPDAATPLLFTGQYTDSESGYIYLRARYYDPQTAQFLTADPFAALTGQRYGYANGDPLNGADPTGLSCWQPSCLWHDAIAPIVAVGSALIDTVQWTYHAAISTTKFVFHIQNLASSWVFDHAALLATITSDLSKVAVVLGVIALFIPGFEEIGVGLLLLVAPLQGASKMFSGVASVHDFASQHYASGFNHLANAVPTGPAGKLANKATPNPPSPAEGTTP